MTSIAILGFFLLILLFFYLGRDDFGLKPTSAQNAPNILDSSKDIELEEKNS
tara:strand:+ start:2998 stop:3153 length:156 start_codon:yes stop_codon:yes gene_type:complete